MIIIMREYCEIRVDLIAIFVRLKCILIRKQKEKRKENRHNETKLKYSNNFLNVAF